MFKLLKNLTKKDYALIVISTILIIFQVWLDLKLPDYMANITSLIFMCRRKFSSGYYCRLYYFPHFC